MANLCIKTPSSASLVLLFQLLVLRPRPTDPSLSLRNIVLQHPRLFTQGQWAVRGSQRWGRLRLSWGDERGRGGQLGGQPWRGALDQRRRWLEPGSTEQEVKQQRAEKTKDPNFPWEAPAGPDGPGRSAVSQIPEVHHHLHPLHYHRVPRRHPASELPGAIFQKESSL